MLPSLTCKPWQGPDLEASFTTETHRWPFIYSTSCRIIAVLWGMIIPFTNWYTEIRSFPGGSVVKNLSVSVEEEGSIPGSGISHREGNGNRLQYSCLENPMDRGVWWATVHGVTESDMIEQLTHLKAFGWSQAASLVHVSPSFLSFLPTASSCLPFFLFLPSHPTFSFFLSCFSPLSFLPLPFFLLSPSLFSHLAMYMGATEWARHHPGSNLVLLKWRKGAQRGQMTCPASLLLTERLSLGFQLFYFPDELMPRGNG